MTLVKRTIPEKKKKMSIETMFGIALFLIIVILTAIILPRMIMPFLK